MSSWPSLALARIKAGEQLVLCSVALAKGSTPRTAGTAMLFSQTEQWLTIGGGHLEWVAAEQARVMLGQPSGPGWSMSRLPLGPSLGQCCGGVVTLLYETLGEEDLGWLQELDSAVRAGQATSRRSQLLLDGNKQVDIQSPSIVDESRLDYDGSQVVLTDLGSTNGTMVNGQRVAAFVDFVNGRSAAYDDHGHGTHVSGTIGATATANGSRSGPYSSPFSVAGKRFRFLKATTRSGNSSLTASPPPRPTPTTGSRWRSRAGRKSTSGPTIRPNPCRWSAVRRRCRTSTASLPASPRAI